MGSTLWKADDKEFLRDVILGSSVLLMGDYYRRLGFKMIHKQYPLYRVDPQKGTVCLIL
jgi:hypothetical protein